MGGSNVLFLFCFSSRRRHTSCALVTEFRRVRFRSRSEAGEIDGAVAVVAMTWLAGPGDADAQAGVRDRLLLAVWCREIRHGRRNRIGRGAEETRQAEQRRSEERRAGKACVRTCRSRWSPCLAKNKES